MNLQLNEKKFYIQHYSKGVTFIGSVVKPYRIYTVKHCVYNFEQSVKKLNKSKNVSQIAQNISSVNSYLGILKHTASYNIRRRVLSKIEKWLWAYLYIRGRFEVLCLKKKYRAYDIIKNQIVKGYETGNIHKWYRYWISKPPKNKIYFNNKQSWKWVVLPRILRLNISSRNSCNYSRNIAENSYL